MTYADPRRTLSVVPSLTDPTSACDLGARIRDLPSAPVGGEVQRERLLSRIETGTPPVWMLTAPFGYGKTVLLRQLAHAARESGRDVIWLALNPDSSAPEMLLRLFAAALGAGLAQDSAHIDAPLWCDAMAHRLGRVLDDRTGLVLCIDGVESIRDPRSAQLLVSVIERWPPACRMYCAGRTSHHLRLGRLLLEERVCELTAQDLALDESELAALAALCGAEAASAAFPAEGWAGGARALLTGSARGTGAAVATLERYIDESLLEALDPSARTALLDAATLSPFTPDMLDSAPGAPTEGSRWRTLLELPPESVFITPDACLQNGYRLHPLVAEQLAAKLRRIDPQRSLDLHRYAADWLERRGHAAQAICHAHLCEDLEFSAALTERAGAFQLSLRDGLDVLRIGTPLTVRDAERYPSLVLGQIYLKAQDGSVDEARVQFEALRAATDNFQRWEELDRQRGARRLADILATVLDLYDDKPPTPEDIRKLEQHLEAAADGDPLGRAGVASLLALIYVGSGLVAEGCAVCEIGLATLRQMPASHTEFYLRVQQAHASLAIGRLKESALYADTARSIAVKLSRWSAGMGIADVFRAVLHYEANELDEAQALLARALPCKPEFTGWFELYALGFSAKAAIAGINADTAALAGVLADAEAIARERRMPRLSDLVLVLRLREAVRAENFPYAVDLLRGDRLTNMTRQIEGSVDKWELRLRTVALLESARLMQRLDRSRDGLALLARVDRRYVYECDACTRFTYFALTAALCHRQRRYQEAFRNFLAAMDLGLEAGLTRRLLDHRGDLLAVYDWAATCGKPMSSRTADFCATALRPARDAESRTMLAGRLLSGRRRNRSAQLDLSPREAEVLQYIAEGLSTKEVADRLGVSISTVKTHRKTLYRKLGAGRRSQALARAREKLIL